MSELEHDPVTGSVGLVLRLRLQSLYNGPIANVRIWESTGSRLAMASKLTLEFTELSIA